MSTELADVLARLDKDDWDVGDAALCAALIRAQAEEIARLRAVVEAAKAELENFAVAMRFDKDQFEDDSRFADWVQSRARHTLDAVRAMKRTEGQAGQEAPSVSAMKCCK